MNFRKLEHFLEIARSAGLSRAAEKLGLSQPALSRELRELEAEFGMPLVIRHARGISLTAAGEILSRKAEQLVAAVQNLKGEVVAADHVLSGRLAFGMPQSMSTVLTGPIVSHFRQAHPNVRLHVREAMSNQLRDGLLTREIDVAVLSAPTSDGPLLTRPLLVEPTVLVGPEDSGLDPTRPVSIDTVAQHPLIAPAFPHGARLLLESALQAIGRRPIISMETDSAPIADFVMRGLGYAVLPSCAVLNHVMVGKAMRHAPITGMSTTWVVACPIGVTMSPAVSEFYRFLYAETLSALGSKRWSGTYLGPHDNKQLNGDNHA